MATIESARRAAPAAERPNAVAASPAAPDPVTAAEAVLRRFGARAVTLLTSARTFEDGRVLPARLSANDCYAALDEACRKTARVALRKYQQNPQFSRVPFAECLGQIFPDPAAYLARAIRSVVADEARSARREPAAVSLEQPIGADDGDSALHLGDVVAETRSWKQPEASLIERDERREFRTSLTSALNAIPANYLEALKRDIARERLRQSGARVSPESDRERQTVCRARAALATILKRECGEDNPYLRLLSQQRSSRVRRKTQPSAAWSGERQEALFRRLMQTGWVERAAANPGADGSVEEAVINEVTAPSPAAPPSPEVRQAMRVMDLYIVDNPAPQTPPAADLYNRARALRQAGNLEEALKCYRACYEVEPPFIEALNEVGIMYSQMGNLRDALKVYLAIVDRNPAGDHKYIAATNAADIYLTWFDAGRNRERNIEQAIHYAQMAMERPTPMRACNLLLAYAKDRYYNDAREVMELALRSNNPACPAEKFLQTLFQIRDADLVAWWNWLDGEMQKEQTEL